MKSEPTIIHKSNLSKSKIKFPDIFGKPIGFLYDERPYYPTCCGYIGTLVVVVVVTVALISESYKMIKQELVSLDQYESKIVNHSHASFFGSFFERKYQPLQTNFEVVISTPNDTLKFGTHINIVSPGNHVEIVSCQKSKFQNQIQSLEGSVQCLRLLTNGLNEEEISLELHKCQSKDCLGSWKDKAITLTLMIETNANNLEINDRFSVNQLKKLDMVINSSFSKQSVLHLIGLESSTATGLIMDSHGFMGLVFRRQISEIMELNPSKVLGKLIIRLDKINRLYVHRQLYQFKNLISFVGGLLKGITMLVFIFVYPFREISYYSGLVNEIFRVCDSPDKLKKMVYVGPATRLLHSKSIIDEKFRTQQSKKLAKKPKYDPFTQQLVEHLETMKVKFNVGGVFQKLIKEVEEEATKKSRNSNLYQADQSLPDKDFVSKTGPQDFGNFMVNYQK